MKVLVSDQIYTIQERKDCIQIYDLDSSHPIAEVKTIGSALEEILIRHDGETITIVQKQFQPYPKKHC